ncbi:uncharacterized protein [Rutidosis leptorrhynchoides]|uniref:uncharacterized protein n=1 Tax=Rutidosis leptorrhynchoides TaxID=125765 RepID=UPI003A99D138
MARLTFVFLKLLLFLLIGISYVLGKSFRRHPLGARNRLTKPTKVNTESSSNSLEYEVYNYTQTLDHFNFKPESYMTFQNRYVIISKYWGGASKNAPIFVYTGEETDVIGDVEYLGFPHILAQRFGALLVYIEHRYYGTSMPFGSEDEAYSNSSTLGYFTSEQALADYAQIIVDLKKNMSAENCPVITIGASYGGMLASWFRMKYPHIAYGAYAASAPILYFWGLTPQTGYDGVVSSDFNSTSRSCHDTIRESWFEIDKVAAQSNGLSSLSQMFNTCMPLNSTQELKENLEEWYDTWAQYDSPADNYLQRFCNATDGAGATTYILNKIIAGFVAVQGNICIYLRDFSRNKTSGWDWQSCTEMVMPMGRGENDTMFQANPFDLDKYTNKCQQAFGVTPRPYWIPVEFGGYGIKTVLEKFASNIIFTNGLRDPYSSGGVLQNISDTVIAIYTEEGHHCLDINTPLDTDPDWLVAQRVSVIDTIQGWLSKYNVPS